ncbi:hypothetical protein K2P47_00725 [Patescibacteria group bacterium]|nr:hypothetical protein [Patescibacteria group bacterium]
MPKKLEVNIDANLWHEMERDTEITMEGLVRRGLSVLKAYREAKRDGLNHLGFVADPTKLDREITNVL